MISVRHIAIGITMLFALRMAMVMAMPLGYDETYYWLYSNHLAAGYFDHPPLIALLVRLGALIAGDTALGIRLFAFLLGIAATGALWRATAILFRDEKLAALSALYFNLSLVASGLFVAATPDAPLMAATAFMLFFLAKIVETGRGVWWLAVGAAAGFGMLSKYTMVFLGFSAVFWLLFVPEMRRWLLTPWPWLAALLAAAMFAPVIYWNAEHEWVSFFKQSGRMTLLSEKFPRTLIFPHVLGQIMIATPFIFLLGAMGLAAFIVEPDANPPARGLVNAMFWPMTIFFLWQSLNRLVYYHWTAPVFLPLAIAAAAAHRMEWQGSWSWLVNLSRRLAVPVASLFVALLYLETTFFILPLGKNDPAAQQIMTEEPMASRIEAVRKQIGAKVVITTGYRLTGWLAFHLPSRPTVIQINERIRWINEPKPRPELFLGPLLYVAEAQNAEARNNGVELIRKLYMDVEEIARFDRINYGSVLDTIIAYRVARPKGDPLDHGPAPDLPGGH